MNEWKKFFWFGNMSQIAFLCYLDFIRNIKWKIFQASNVESNTTIFLKAYKTEDTHVEGTAGKNKLLGK